MGQYNVRYNEFSLKIAPLNFEAPTNWYTGRTGQNFVVFVETGEAEITIRGESLIAKKGQCLFVPSNETGIKILFTGKPFSGYEISFRFFPSVQLYQYRFQLVDLSPEAKQSLYEIPIDPETTTKKVWRFYRFINQLQPTLKECEQKYFHIVTKALEYMEKFDVYDIPTLAEHCGVKERRFYNIFKRITGTTPIKEKQRIQAYKAEYLLKHTDLSIREISDLLGYHSECYFRKVFYSRYQELPSKYRKK